MQIFVASLITGGRNVKFQKTKDKKIAQASKEEKTGVKLKIKIK